MSEEPEAPPVGWWGTTWRVLVMLLISALALVGPANGAWNDHPSLFWLDITLGLASYALTLFRRRWPVAVALLTTLAGFVSATSAGASALATVSLATHRRPGQIVVVGVLGVVSGQVFATTQEQQTGPWWLTLVFSIAITVAIMAIGAYVGSRRELLWTLRERARAAEEQQELRVASARSAERERIAREMHDVLAHRISMVSMHAGALAFRTDLPPEQVRETAELIQHTSHEALTDLRQVLGFLRDGDPAVRDRPQPTLGDLPGLVEEARQAGMRVDLTVAVGGPDESDRPLPEPVGRTVYRIVQEGLTNARKHALGAAVRVAVTGSAEDGVEVHVSNDVRPGTTRTPGAGLGLVGLRERTELAGGRLEVLREGGRFSLRGWLPWTT